MPVRPKKFIHRGHSSPHPHPHHHTTLTQRPKGRKINLRSSFALGPFSSSPVPSLSSGIHPPSPFSSSASDAFALRVSPFGLTQSPPVRPLRSLVFAPRPCLGAFPRFSTSLEDNTPSLPPIHPGEKGRWASTRFAVWPDSGAHTTDTPQTLPVSRLSDRPCFSLD